VDPLAILDVGAGLDIQAAIFSYFESIPQ
jgi:hypothetical protein